MEFENLGIKIKKVQNVQLEILLEFDKICKKHDIKYQLFAGTLLGAVRHDGFIPWDDDIDVCLLRKDYEKFKQLCTRDLNTKYFLQTYETDKNYIMQFAKIRKNNTIFRENSTAECEIHQGVYIDIFPMDNIMPDTSVGKLQQKLLYIIGRINVSRIKKNCLNAKKPIIKKLSIMNYYVLKIIPNSYTNKLQKNIACMFENKKTKYVTHLSNNASMINYNKYMMESDKFYNVKDSKFENNSFPIPQNYDEVLSKLFGEYMTPPPIDEQKPHHGIVEIILD